MAERVIVRRRSLAGPIVLIVLGVLFLLGNLHVLSWWQLRHYFAQWWPLLLILWGAIKLIEYLAARNEGVPARGIGAGGVVLIIFIILFGLGATGFEKLNMQAFDDDWQGPWIFGGEKYTFGPQEIQQELVKGASVRVVDDHGDVVINTWDQAGVKVVYSKQIAAESQDKANQIDQQTKPTLNFANGVLLISANTAQGNQRVRTDLQIYAPKDVAVNIDTRHGDVQVRNRTANVQVTNNHGDVVVEDVTGDLSATLRHGSLLAARVTGEVTLDGKVEDTNLTDIGGNVRMNGDFFGDMTLAKIGKSVSFHSSRTDLELSKLEGQLTMDGDDLKAAQISGPVRVTTRSKNIHLDNVSGAVELENSNGEIAVTGRLPLGDMQIRNRNGDVQLTLPAQSAFVLDAQTSRGDITSEFSGLNINTGSHQSRATGSFGSGGSKVQISNEHGNVEIRKAG